MLVLLIGCSEVEGTEIVGDAEIVIEWVRSASIAAAFVDAVAE